ncbi:MAG TPA: DMT family transporter [Terriglobales bacterium]|nr:DMT family transporter [Terriglobales bacterium]
MKLLTSILAPAPALKSPAAPTNPSFLGTGAALLTVAIWAGWIVATRFAGETAISPITTGLFRYGPPALLLAPVWWRCGLLPRGCPWWIIVLMTGGSGAPFFLLAAWAMKSVPAAAVGALLPGTMPLWAALIGALVAGACFQRRQYLGYSAIALGVALMVVATSAAAGPAPARISQGALLLAAACWAAYSHAFKRSGLTALQGAAVTAAWSFLLHLVLAFCFGRDLGRLTPQVLAIQITTQGLLSGLIAIFSYGVAIRHLGAARAAAFSALAPALAMLGGAALLGERPGTMELVAILLVTLGVALANGFTLPLRRSPSRG